MADKAVRYPGEVWDLARAMQKAAKRLGRGSIRDLMPIGNAPTTEVGHAMDCVRTNGTGKLNSPLDAYRAFEAKLREFNQAVRRLRAKRDEVREEARMLRELVKSTLIICPGCRGKGGGGDPLYGSGVTKHPDGLWWDCGRCSGAGLVPKEKDQ